MIQCMDEENLHKRLKKNHGTDSGNRPDGGGRRAL